MIKITAMPLLVNEHVDAVMKRVEKSFDSEKLMDNISALGMDSIETFLTADVDMMRQWTKQCPEKLQFTEFKDIYNKYFSNGAEKYVDKNYNAYKFLKSADITVCPYCDDETLDVVWINGKLKRTSEIDHFFPKSLYPALAMCFYNLIPSGQQCNGLKMEHEIGTNPYEENIEHLTYLYPNLPVGVLMENVDEKDCKVLFHPKDGMIQNVEQLGLQQRYERYAPEVHKLLTNLQNFSEEKIEELVRLGLGSREKIISIYFGPQDPKEKKNALRQKMLKDLTGY